MKYHVVCRDCTFEKVVYDLIGAGNLRDSHEEETGHDVTYGALKRAGQSSTQPDECKRKESRRQSRAKANRDAAKQREGYLGKR